MEQALEKLRQLKAMLAAITGSVGTDELGDDLAPYLAACHSIAAEAVALAESAPA